MAALRKNTSGIGILSVLFFCAVVFSSDSLAQTPVTTTPLSDALGVWHFADEVNTADRNAPLEVHGNVKLGIALTGDEAAESRLRCGDALAADFSDGGWLNAGLGTDRCLDIAGRTLSIYLRLRDASGKWDCPIFSRHGGHERLAYNVFCIGDFLGAEIGTTRNKSVLLGRAPFGEMLDTTTATTRWHDVIVRVNGAKLELFVDGRCTDEDFMLGDLRQSNLPLRIGGQNDDESEKVRDGFRGQIDTAAIWNRPLTHDEIVTLSGGPDRIDPRLRTDRGNGESMQYWMPPNRYAVGDCMPFYANGVFHFMYLLDKGHHSAKNGLGAHQWIQATSTDLVHWTHQPFVVEIDRQEEGSICTGSVFYHDGQYYAFYANRSAVYKSSEAEHPDIFGLLCLSTSKDGIHFTKSKVPIISLSEDYGTGTRDPVVFQNPETGQFHLYATSSYRGLPCWTHLISDHLADWKPLDPVYSYKDGDPECPDWFEWGGNYYTIANHLNGYWRISETPTGPWDIPDGPNTLMPGIINVPKTAPFKDGRRIICGWTREHGFGGHAVFHELILRDDGSLGEKFVPEMIPAVSQAVVQREKITDPETVLADLPGDLRFRATLTFDPNRRDLIRDWILRYDDERTLTVSPRRRTVTLGAFTLDRVDFSTGWIDLDLIIKGDLIDLCLNEDRTVTDTLPAASVRTFVLQNDIASEMVVEKLEIAPLAKK